MLQLVYGSRYAKSGVEPLQTCSWTSAFLERFRDDAHAWCYVAYDEDGDELTPQLRIPAKRGAPDFDGTLLFSLLFFDYDGEESHEQIFEALEKIPEDHYLLKIACLYLTKGGIRLVYRLDEPVLFEEFGKIVRGVSMDLWHITGLQIDVTTDQWWRCFRLPNVVRDDGKATGPTWEQDYYQEPLLDPNAELDVGLLPRRVDKLPWAKRSSTHSAEDMDMPDSDLDLPKPRQQLYKSAFRSSRWRHYLFDDIPVPEGKRDQTIMAMAGEISAIAYQSIPEADPGEVFLLICPTIRGMEPDGPEGWDEKLWRLILHAWAGEEGKSQEREDQLEHDLDERSATIDAMLKHLPTGEAPKDEQKRMTYAKRHFFLQTGSGAFAVQRDGTYTTTPLRSGQLPAHLNDGLLFLDPEEHFRTPYGIPLGGDALLNLYSVNLDNVEYVPAQTSTAKLVRAGNQKILQISPFQLRPDLVEAAEFDKDIDEWLDSFNQAKLLKRWLASSLALDQGGTAALYLHGPARVGKSMLAVGLAECFNTQPVPGSQAFATFNSGLFHSPVIMVDEGLPDTTGTGVDAADMFRSMVTGSPISIQKKFQHAVTSKIPYRIVFAANSFDMVKQLIGRRTMAPQDRDAFRERILVLDTGGDPARYLDSHGAMEFTRDWIGKGHRLARHIIRLYQLAFEEGDFERDGRLLVEGKVHPAFTLSFDLSGCGHDVVDDLTQDIFRLWENKPGGTVELRKGLKVDKTSGRIWVKKRPYSKYSCKRSNRRNPEPYSRALERFLTESTRVSSIDGAIEQLVDLDKLIFCATSEGLGVNALNSLSLTARGVSVP